MYFFEKIKNYKNKITDETDLSIVFSTIFTIFTEMQETDLMKLYENIKCKKIDEFLIFIKKKWIDGYIFKINDPFKKHTKKILIEKIDGIADLRKEIQIDYPEKIIPMLTHFFTSLDQATDPLVQFNIKIQILSIIIEKTDYYYNADKLNFFLKTLYAQDFTYEEYNQFDKAIIKIKNFYIKAKNNEWLIKVGQYAKKNLVSAKNSYLEDPINEPDATKPIKTQIGNHLKCKMQKNSNKWAIILHGEPGSGKTHFFESEIHTVDKSKTFIRFNLSLANMKRNQIEFEGKTLPYSDFIKIVITEYYQNELKNIDKDNCVFVLLIDECESICGNRNSKKANQETENQTTIFIQNFMDDLNSFFKQNKLHGLLCMTTNTDIENIDLAVKDRCISEYEFTNPTSAEFKKIIDEKIKEKGDESKKNNNNVGEIFQKNLETFFKEKYSNFFEKAENISTSNIALLLSFARTSKRDFFYDLCMIENAPNDDKITPGKMKNIDGFKIFFNKENTIRAPIDLSQDKLNKMIEYLQQREPPQKINLIIPKTNNTLNKETQNQITSNNNNLHISFE